jgi:hypothetical protein
MSLWAVPSLEDLRSRKGKALEVAPWISRLLHPAGVFTNLGFGDDEAEHLRLRSTLMIEVRKLIEERKLTQADTGKVIRGSEYQTHYSPRAGALCASLPGTLEGSPQRAPKGRKFD